MPNFDPAQPLPPEYQSTVQTQPMLPGQGFAITGLPSNPNPGNPIQTNPFAMGAPLQPTAPAPPVAPVAAPVSPIAPPVAAPSMPQAGTEPIETVAPVAKPAGKKTGVPSANQAPDLGALMQGAVGQAPVTDEVDTELAAPVPVDPTPPDNLTPEQAEVWRAGQESIRNARERTALAEQQSVIDQQAAQERAKVATAHEVEANRQYEQQQIASAEAVKLSRDAAKSYQDFKFHDYWSDKSAAQRGLASLGILLGSASYDSNHVNRAANMLQDSITSEFKKQEIDLQRKEKLMSMRSHDVGELQDMQVKERAALRFRQAAQLEAIAAKTEAMAVLGKNQGNVLAAKELATAARQHAAQFNLTAQKSLEESITLRLQNEHIQAQTTKDLAQAAKLGRGKSTGTGSGANSTGDLFAGMSSAEKRQMRGQFHQDVAKNAGVIEKEYVKPYVEVKNALKFVEEKPDNPEAWIGIRDFFVRSISGGKVTQAQYKQAAEHGAGSVDKLNQIIESFKTGMPSLVQRKNLLDAAKALAVVYERNMQEQKHNFESTYGEDEMVKKGDPLATRTYKSHASRLFKEVPDAPVGAKAEGKPDRMALAREALADPGAPPAVKERAKAILAGK